MKDVEQHPAYVKDGTAWEYRYSGETSGDQGDDTKDHRPVRSPRSYKAWLQKMEINDGRQWPRVIKTG